MDYEQNNLAIKNMEERLQKIEQRILSLENKVNAELEESNAEQDDSSIDSNETVEEREERYESIVGQSWMALIGTIVIVTGLCFFLSLSYESLPPVTPALIGLFLSGGIFVFSVTIKKSYSIISQYMLGGVILLFYFSTVRLHFFGEAAIKSLEVEIILLTVVVIINLLISLRKKSIYLVSISLILGLITSLLSHNVFYLYVILTAISVLSNYLKQNYGWSNIIYFLMPLTFITHLLWFILYASGPDFENTMPSVFINTFFVLIYSAIYFTGNIRRKEPFPEPLSIGAFSFFNASFVVLIIISIVNITQIENSSPNYFLAAFFFMVFATISWEKEKSKYSTFIYAMSGYFALSFAIISLNIPNYLVWLSWQSLLVLATAVWFKSKFIVVANFFIYAAVLANYYITTASIDLFALSFGLVALLSARILNWNKDRLELTTEQMRNVYLISAFIAIPYTLYFTMPENFVSISWIVVAVIYYSLSIVLNNKKYRWMSIYTFLLTLFYVAILGFTSTDTTYKIISFLALGLVLITISIVYTKRKLINK
jgi:hypothetical protein